MSRIAVEIARAPLDLDEAWLDLASHAAPNVFMSPTALNAVVAAGFAKIQVLLAYDEAAEPRRLVGIWALEKKSPGLLRPALLAGPPYDYSFLANPVVDPALIDEVVAAFFAAIAEQPSLPKVVRLRYLDADAPTFPAIARTLDGARCLRLTERSRPFATAAAGTKRSGSTRKKMRQDWNRLSAAGTPAVVNERAPDGVRAAFEIFLGMEAASWKGEQGTAILSHEADAAFARLFIGKLADANAASVALLTVSGKPVAAQVMLYSESTAYTWKIAFDAEYGKYSPGGLLVDRLTEELFSRGIEAIESCSPEGGFLAQIWSGQRTSVDMLVNAAGKSSLGFTLTAFRENARIRLRKLRDSARAFEWRPALGRIRQVLRPART